VTAAGNVAFEIAAKQLQIDMLSFDSHR